MKKKKNNKTNKITHSKINYNIIFCNRNRCDRYEEAKHLPTLMIKNKFIV